MKLSFSEKKAKVLYKFLKKHCCLQQYVYNVIKSSYAKNTYIIAEYIEDKNIIKLFISLDSDISNSFLWTNTKEGYLYWSTIHQKFILENNKYFNF